MKDFTFQDFLMNPHTFIHTIFLLKHGLALKQMEPARYIKKVLDTAYTHWCKFAIAFDVYNSKTLRAIKHYKSLLKKCFSSSDFY